VTSRDDDLERRLRRYRPTGPPAGLRARVLRARREASWLRIVTWAAAAALAVAVLGSVAASRIYRDLSEQLGNTAESVHDTDVRRLSTVIGTDPEALMEAEAIASRSEAEDREGPMARAAEVMRDY